MGKDFKAAVNKTNLGQKSGIAGLVSNTNNNSNTNNISNTDNIDNNNIDVRQTFVLTAGNLDKIKDYVHYKRMQGETEYTQKQALNDALKLLFDTVPNLPKRK